MTVLNNLNLPEFIDFNEAIDIALSGKKKSLRRCYIPVGDVVTIAGYRTLDAPALFTTSEEGTIDKVAFEGKERVVLTGLKQRAVIRRIHSSFIRGIIGDNYKCVVPDNLCGHCVNCFQFGSMNSDTGIQVKSRTNITSSFSLQSADEAISEDEEFHIMVHSDLSMAKGEGEGTQKGASIYTNEVIKPETVFPFLVYIYSPSQFDIVSYIKSHLIADLRGYGSYSTIRSQARSEFILITKDLSLSPSVMLNKSKEEILKSVENKLTITGDSAIKSLADQFESMANTYKNKLYQLGK
ncbi:MAG: type I-D CRISPR-associated protein Cas7/Csc2 [Nitrospirae bacterium]|nr:type I-D CRISPR-associated protein Cas7/Csc2 [Nitrospirota bacterium]